MKPEKFIVNTEQLMNLLKVSRQTITNWKDQGLPVHARGKWDLIKVFEWYVERTTIERESYISQFDLDQERARKTKIEADIKQIELDILQGKAVTIEDATTSTSKLLVAIKSIVMNIPQTAAPKIIGKNLKEIKLILQDHLRESLSLILNFTYFKEDEKGTEAPKKKVRRNKQTRDIEQTKTDTQTPGKSKRKGEQV